MVSSNAQEHPKLVSIRTRFKISEEGKIRLEKKHRKPMAASKGGDHKDNGTMTSKKIVVLPKDGRRCELDSVVSPSSLFFSLSQLFSDSFISIPWYFHPFSFPLKMP